MRVLDLFSGIGGFSLGLERAGMRTVAFCEIEPYCQAVLRKHWPNVPIYEDVRSLNSERLAADGIAVDVICGGFPCQDISTAGKGAGLAGERSGLWREYARIIGEVRPSFVIVENVSALLGRGLGDVLGDLAALGYDAEWHCIPASAVGAPHRRDRVWIVGNSRSAACEWNAGKIFGEEARERGARKQNGHLLDGPEFTSPSGGTDDVANTECLRGRESAPSVEAERQSFCQTVREESSPESGSGRKTLAHPNGAGYEGQGCWQATRRRFFTDSNLPRFREFETEPDVGRVANGVSNWTHRIKALGNAVVPQIPEIIGRSIMALET